MAAICDIFGWPIEEYLEVAVAFLLTAGVLILGADLTAADSGVNDQTV